MKVCTFAEFAALPEGTIFSYWQPCVSAGLYVKGDTWHDAEGRPNDFLEWRLLPQLPCPSEGNELPALSADDYGRWGMYDYDQLFAVYEAADLAVLADAISQARKVGVPSPTKSP